MTLHEKTKDYQINVWCIVILPYCSINTYNTQKNNNKQFEPKVVTMKFELIERMKLNQFVQSMQD